MNIQLSEFISKSRLLNIFDDYTSSLYPRGVNRQPYMSEIKHMSVILLKMIIKSHNQTLAGRKLNLPVLCWLIYQVCKYPDSSSTSLYI